LLAEFGVVLPLRSVTVRRQALQAAEALPELARRAIEDLCSHLRGSRFAHPRYDRELDSKPVSPNRRSAS